MSKLLINEPPLQVLPSLAERIGLNEAIVLQQVHYWLENNKKSNRNKRIGRYWAYNTYEGWREQFPFWSVETVKRILKSLERQGIVIIGNFNKSPFDRTKWYSIDYEVLEGIKSPEKQQESPLGQVDPREVVKMTSPIPETTREGEAVGIGEELFRHLQILDLQKKVTKEGSRRRMNRINRTVV